MENFNQIFSLIAEEDSFNLNSAILESGVINILGLIAIIVIVGKDGLGSLLQERQETISQNVKDAENRLNEAENRLNEAKKQLSQASVVINKRAFFAFS
jgi:F0F1-type ATP synthase membrane subunit b/b'